MRKDLREIEGATGGGSSAFATRALLLADMASVDHGEITDKGYINQRAVIVASRGRGDVAGRRRVAGVDRLREYLICQRATLLLPCVIKRALR